MFGLKISEVFVTLTLGRQFMRTKIFSEIEKHGFSKIEKKNRSMYYVAVYSKLPELSCNSYLIFEKIRPIY